jgi:hypothetical protein
VAQKLPAARAEHARVREHHGLTSFTPWYTLKKTMKNTSVMPSATLESTPSPNHTAKIGARITRGIAFIALM